MGGQRLTPVTLPPYKRPSTHCVGGCVGLRAGLDGCEYHAPTGIRSPDRPARSKSLRRLRYPSPQTHTHIYMYIGFKMFFYAVRHLDSTASYLSTGLHLAFFRSWTSLFLSSSFSSVFLVLSFVLTSTSMLFWAIFLLPFFEHGRNM